MTAVTDHLNTALAGRYRIEKHLGEGGMATVYLAEDLKHKRRVAIKLLKPELAAVLGGDRFVQEITTTASLQHPHILPLFDSGTADGFLFYVMPFIEGETLRDKLNRETQLGVDEAVRIAREVADALDYAHRHGVIHRDIKPENILLHDGRPMVADFGIALAVSAAAGGRMTETGLSLGTPHYMSPEQATAEKEITARSDIYSVGSVLFEMLTGNPPHTGANAQQIIMKIISEPAEPVTKYRRSVPPNVAAAVAKAVEKLPADRFESAKAFGDALQNAAFTTPTTRAQFAVGGASRRALAVVSGIAVVAIAIAGWLVAVRPRSVVLPVTRSRLGLPDSLQLNSGNSGSHMAISRDGAAILFVAAAGSRTVSSVWYRPSDQVDVRLIPGTEGAISVAFSPDGKRFAFVRNRELFVAGVDGSPSTIVAGLREVDTAISWLADDALIVRVAGALARVPVGGGPVQQLTTYDTAAHEDGHLAPETLPNGKGMLFTVQHLPNTFIAFWDIAVADFRSGKHRVLARGVRAWYAASGHIVYVTAEGILMAMPFDQDRLEATGSPVAVGDGVTVRPNGAVELTMSGTGTLVYLRADGAAVALRELIWVDRSGSATPLDTAWRGTFDAVAISPNGKQVAVSMVQQTAADVWVRNLDGGTVSKLSFEAGLSYRPSWYPDGSRVAFVSNARGQFDMVAKRADGVGATDVVVHEARSLAQGFVSRDGKWAVYRTNAVQTGAGDIAALRLGDSVPVPLVSTPAEERYAALSPDGRWLAYRSSEANRPEVYVQPFPNTSGGKWTVSRGGGSEPLWSRSGEELFYVDEVNGAMMAVAVQSEPSFAAQAPRELFKLPAGMFRAISHQAFDIAPDDRRFLMIRSVLGNTQASSGSARPMDNVVVVQNWFEELRAKAPTKK